MAQPRATAEKVRTSETDWPLRPHVQEQRQNSVTYIYGDVRNTSPAIIRLPPVPFEVDRIEFSASGGFNVGLNGPCFLFSIDELVPFFGRFVHAREMANDMSPTVHEFARPYQVPPTYALSLFLGDSTAGQVGRVKVPTDGVRFGLRITFHRNPK